MSSMSGFGPSLVPLDSLMPSAYNPRTCDLARLDLVTLSLKKLGWLLPVYALPGGGLSSGHQRTLAAAQAGFTHAPAVTLPALPLEKAKALNVLFNRATNDLDTKRQPGDLHEALLASPALELLNALPDVDPESRAAFPCLDAREESLKNLLDNPENQNRPCQYARNAARHLAGYGVRMPIVCRGKGRIVNGLGRALAAAMAGEKTWPVVWLSGPQGEAAEAVLNLLSMDWDIHTRYADTLRYNSFRRSRQKRVGLGRGFTFGVLGNRPAKELNLTRPEDRARWTALHGRRVVDFGAGLLTETELLRAAGVEVAAFEPYRLNEKQEIDPDLSRETSRQFLAQVAERTRFTSVFCASVLNSVPFESDRRHLVAILAALCAPVTDRTSDPQTICYACASGRDQTGWLQASGGVYSNDKDGGTLNFALSYEPGVCLSEFQTAPKVQKYHGRQEFHDLFATAFYVVAVHGNEGNVYARARWPILDLAVLSAALEFEFDLPYPDGTRMGLVAEAKEAFGKRLGVNL